MIAMIIDEDLLVLVFLGLLEIEGEKFDVVIIFVCLINHLKIWGLHLCKSMVFASNGTSAMVDSYGGITTY